MLNGKIGYVGVVLGAVSLLLALVHFWAGPLAPQPSLEEVVAETTIGIKDATIRILQGEEAPEPKRAEWNIDRSFQVTTAVLGGLAIIFSLIAYLRHEPKRPVIAAAALGAGAITFQLLSWLALVLIGLVFIVIIFQHFDFLSGLGG